jgi:hypothetical protein
MINAVPRRKRHQRLVVLANIAACCLVFLAIAVVPRSARVVVFVSPFSEAGRVLSVVAAAGATFVNAGRRPWIAIADGPADNAVTRLYAAGALLVLDGSVGLGCLQPGLPK